MSTQLIPFSFESSSIRVIVINDEPWFVAADVCEALTIGNSRMALERLDDDEKGVSSIDTPGGNQELSIINESGMYSLILTSRKPEAKKFKKWVTSEVLPAIRKTGRYEAAPQPISQPSQKAVALETALVMREVAKALRAAGLRGNALTLAADGAAKSITGLSLLSIAGTTHLVANPQGMTYTPTELGRLMTPPLSAHKVNLLLEARGLQTKEMDHWIPTDAAQGLCEWLDTGKRHSNGTPVKQIKWLRAVLERLQGQKREAA